MNARSLRKLLPAVALLAACGDVSSVVMEQATPSSSERGTFALDIVIDEGALRRGTNDFTVHAFNHAGQAASVVGVSARMPGHAHGFAPPRIDCADGACRVSDLLLTMPGRWEITLRLSGLGEIDDATLVATLR